MLALVHPKQSTKLIAFLSPAVEPDTVAKTSPTTRANLAGLGSPGYRVVSILMIASWVWLMMIYHARRRSPRREISCLMVLPPAARPRASTFSSVRFVERRPWIPI
jgi:hypothetical protein